MSLFHIFHYEAGFLSPLDPPQIPFIDLNNFPILLRSGIPYYTNLNFCTVRSLSIAQPVTIYILFVTFRNEYCLD